MKIDNRIPPSSIELERTVLGSMLIKTALIPTALAMLSTESFYITTHKHIFSMISAMDAEGESVDVVLLAERMKEAGKIEAIGGIEYLSELTENVATSANIEQHCRQLFEYQLRREAIERAAAVQAAAYSLDKEIGETISAIENIGLEIAEKSDSGGIARNTAARVVTVNETRGKVDEYREYGFSNIGVDPGPDGLKNHWRLAKGFISVITGIPFHGKSELMEQIMVHTAEKKGWKWAVFSPENYPYVFLMEKLCQKKTGKDFRREMTEAEYGETMNFLHDHFYLIEPNEDKTTVTDILRIIKNMNIDALMIDPWNRLILDKMYGEGLADATGRHLDRICWMTRKKNIATCIVAHPKNLEAQQYGKDKGAYPVVKAYDLYGGSMWANKADNILSIYRNFDTGITQLHVLKVKFRAHGRAPAVIDYMYKDPPGIFVKSSGEQLGKKESEKENWWND